MNYLATKKGLGVVCCNPGGLEKGAFVVEFFGEVYPPWRWYEKESGVKSLLSSKDPTPEFYNIYLEKPRGDYDVIVVDAMHKANYASRLNHSCDPNCEARVAAINEQYQIAIFTLREIHFGEELTINYRSITESAEEVESSICLCGSRFCRGTYLDLIGEGEKESQSIMKDEHPIMDRLKLLVEACEMNVVSAADHAELERAGLGKSLLDGLPPWLEAYSARLASYINGEKAKLQEKLTKQILKKRMEEDNFVKKGRSKKGKSKKGKSISLTSQENEKSPVEVQAETEAENQAEDVYNQRLQNLAITLDKVKYVMRSIYGDMQMAPPILQKLLPEDITTALSKGADSFFEVLHTHIAPHMSSGLLNDLETTMHLRRLDQPNISAEIEEALINLQHECRSLPCKDTCDQLLIYVYTQFFVKIHEHKSITSSPLRITRLDLGTRYSGILTNPLEYSKTYEKNYCLGQLLFWHIQEDDLIAKTLQILSCGDLGFEDKV